MKTLLIPLTCLSLLFSPATRGDEVPYFSALHDELSNRLTVASNTVPRDKKLLASLRSNLKIVDKTKPTLTAGSGALGNLARSLGKTTLSNTFLPIVIETRTTYLGVMDSNSILLVERLADTIPGKTQDKAQASLDKLALLLEDAGTNAVLALSLKSLNKAAKELDKAAKNVGKAETAKPPPDFLTATIVEPNYGTNAFKPTKDFLDATYDPLTGDLNAEFGILKSLGKPRTLSRFLSLNAIVPGSGSYTLSLTNDNEGYGLYQRAVVLNIDAEEPEVESEDLYLTIEPFNRRLGSGTMTIWVDLEAKIVWGSFEFTAIHTENRDLEVRMAGSFLVRLFIYEDEFE